MASTIATAVSTLDPGRVSGTGITSVLRDSLRGGVPFTAPLSAQPGVGKQAKKARNLGSRSDREVGKIIDKKMRLSEGCARTKAFFRALEKRGITPVRSQVMVCVPKLGIKTAIDAIGVTKDGKVVVIEQKCTLSTCARHLVRYRQPCMKRRRLTNGLLNNEYNAHQLQTAFGIMGLQRILPNCTITGVVVVCTSDDACVYDVVPSYVDPVLFNQLRVVQKKPPKTETFAQPPKSEQSKAFLLDIVKSFGYTKLETRLTRYGSFVASAGKHLVVVGLVHTPDPKSRASEAKRKKLQEDTKKLWMAKKKKAPVKGYIVFYTGVGGTYKHEIVSNRRAAR